MSSISKRGLNAMDQGLHTTGAQIRATRPWAVALCMVAATWALGGCHDGQELIESEQTSSLGIDPHAKPILRLTFEVTDIGYRLVGTRQTMGRADVPATVDHDVLVTTLDAQGDQVATAGLDNPRRDDTSAAGPSVLANATVAVNFDEPYRIHSVRVRVVRGPNARLDRTFLVPAPDRD